MKKTRYSESQMIKVLKEVEGGCTVKAVCREYGIAEGTYYSWKSTYGGMEASDIKLVDYVQSSHSISLWRPVGLWVFAIRSRAVSVQYRSRRCDHYWPTASGREISRVWF